MLVLETDDDHDFDLQEYRVTLDWMVYERLSWMNFHPIFHEVMLYIREFLNTPLGKEDEAVKHWNSYWEGVDFDERPINLNYALESYFDEQCAKHIVEAFYKDPQEAKRPMGRDLCYEKRFKRLKRIINNIPYPIAETLINMIFNSTTLFEKEASELKNVINQSALIK